MRIVIIAMGSRGDVQPYVALGKGLHSAGHQVRLMTHDAFEQLVTGHGLEFWIARGNVQAIAESEEMQALLEKGNFLAINAYTAKAAQKAALEWAEDGLSACAGADLLIAGIGGLFIGLSLAEKLHLPLIQAYYVPFTPTREISGALLPRPVPDWLNRLSHHAVRQIMWQGARKADNLARQQVLGSPKAPFFGPFGSRQTRGLPILYGFSPAVIAPPADWPVEAQVTGNWFLEAEADWSPPPALVDFLDAGASPVYVGFGSMTNRKPEETAVLVMAALAKTGQRAVLLSGWGGLQAADLPDNVFMLKAAPHDWLFPRMAAVVHHGGAGTTAAGLRAGVPSIIVPFFADQPFWGRQVARLGVGPQPVPRQRLTVDGLAAALETAVSNPQMRQRAADLGQQIQAEDGVAKAVAIVQRLAAQL
ncbi:MAG: glycosyltransferase family 1 protein [Ardenticatenaceae bacterium]|nr:glycosyltransferase family 1 protein [Anaerolineales bacterium]MCB8940562.1 glycosyltransferase family 1 protein [Ardenticatenaceae bacterium]MCB8973582.1 glycosyltransferase family 1 protein [Ardenticatenaceae bacterium]